jgi:hypothetical protein
MRRRETRAGGADDQASVCACSPAIWDNQLFEVDGSHNNWAVTLKARNRV